MSVLARDQVAKATQPNCWDFSNRILYDLCSKHPEHTNLDIVLAKILLIGRVYSAAIERRRRAEAANDDFYISKVGPNVMKSDIDRWIERARAVEPDAGGAFDVMIKVHEQTTDLFREISGLEKRSLASKYLHFHVPRLFFLYDRRAVLGIRKLRSIVGRTCKYTGDGDHEYRRFVQKCFGLQQYCLNTFELRLSLVRLTTYSSPAPDKLLSRASRRHVFSPAPAWYTSRI